MAKSSERIDLSLPHVSGEELKLVLEVFASTGAPLLQGLIRIPFALSRPAVGLRGR